MNKTYGQKLVGISFNPGQREDVNDIKQKCADIIDNLTEQRDSCDRGHESAMIFDEAIRRIMDAQMWAVKAVTYGG